MSKILKKVPVLDHGYVMFVESWGSDERIVETARMSTQRGFVSWESYKRCRRCDAIDGAQEVAPQSCRDTAEHDWQNFPRGDAGLLAYLHEAHHDTPFEFAGLTIEVQLPIMCFREWHRHRTQCLAPSTLVHFDAPKSKKNRRFVSKMTIEEVWRKWQPTIRTQRPHRQKNAFWPRSRIAAMQLRMCVEDTGEIGHTRVVDVIRGEPKPMIRVTTTSGRSLTATRTHRVFTSKGWLTLGNAIETNALLAMEGTRRGFEATEPPLLEGPETWKPIVGWRNYEVSDLGRVRRVGKNVKKLQIGANGYYVCSLNRPGKQELRTVHSLVADAFLRPRTEGEVVRHINHNRLDARACNLTIGSMAENAADTVEADRQQRLVVVYESVDKIEDVGLLPTYDIAVEGPWHNFVADGFVVHNSYSEMSARYAPLPALDYMPTPERCLVVNGANKQANALHGSDELTHEQALRWLGRLAEVYALAEDVYQDGLKTGLPKEVARLPLTMGRYSRMRATANLRNWLGFMTLRSDHHLNGAAAQLEIRLAANIVGDFVAEHFPRVYDLYVEPKRRGPLVGFDAVEQAAVRRLIRAMSDGFVGIKDLEEPGVLAEEVAGQLMPPTRLRACLAKLKKMLSRA